MPPPEQHPVADVEVVVRGGFGARAAGLLRAALVVHREQVGSKIEVHPQLHGAAGDVHVLPVEEEVLTETAEAVEGGGAERQTGSAEPVCPYRVVIVFGPAGAHAPHAPMHLGPPEVRRALARSEEHTSELQS